MTSPAGMSGLRPGPRPGHDVEDRKGREDEDGDIGPRHRKTQPEPPAEGVPSGAGETDDEGRDGQEQGELEAAVVIEEALRPVDLEDGHGHGADQGRRGDRGENAEEN